MKNSFLALALEEAGLVEPVEQAADASVDPAEVLEEIQDENETSDGLVNELDTVIEVQEGLEALVSSMEGALSDPHYSPREYQLQVSHAAALLGRVGLGLPAGLSCESTDGASDAKDSFADKAKKFGKLILEYIQKIIEWFKEKFTSSVERTKKLFDGLKAKADKAKKEGVKWKSEDIKVEAVKVPEGIETKEPDFKGYIGKTVALMRLIESKLEKIEGVKEEDVQEFVDEYLKEFAEAAKDLPGKLEFTITGFKFTNTEEVLECHTGPNADNLLADGGGIMVTFTNAGQHGRDTVERVSKKVASSCDGPVKYRAATGLCNTLLGVTQYGSILATSLAQVVLAKIKTGTAGDTKAE